MNEALQIVIGFVILFAVFVLTRYGIYWRIKRACSGTIRDLEAKGALGPASAVDLPYAKKEFFRIGLRDFRPKAVETLVAKGVVAVTESGRYYLTGRG